MRLQVLLILLLGCFYVNAQSEISYSFIAAGHAYGSHEGDNIGLHPLLLSSLNTGYDSSVAFAVFTGDIVNHSTPESWQQVENELDSLSLTSYYVMGNHDDNEAGYEIFEDKFGASYYSWYFRNELYIVLNSIEADRAISETQLTFLQEKIVQAGDTTRNIFIFFHEILWNSHEKYIGVRSNSRSRYDQIVEISNYWEEVHPILMDNSDKRFFLIAGDVGGNSDAIAAFYDRWDHITFLASGMGEVADENYLLVHIYGNDSTGIELVALNSEVILHEIEFYSVPPAPSAIVGPTLVSPRARGVEYGVSEIVNASSYLWEVPQGVTGYSTINRIALDFDDGFKDGRLSVQAEKEGFGKGPLTSMSIFANATSSAAESADLTGIKLDVIETSDLLLIELNMDEGEIVTLSLFDAGGRVYLTRRIVTKGTRAEIQINKENLSEGILILSASSLRHYTSRKLVIRHGYR